MERNLDVHLEDFLKRLGRRLDDLLEDFATRMRASVAAPRHADARHNPLGSGRAFLDAGRRGDFPTYRRGREVVALWSDVERYIESKRRPVMVDTALEDDRALLERAGVPLRRTPPNGATKDEKRTLDVAARKRAQ